MAGMRISLFGPFRVADDAHGPVEIRARKNRALLATLASCPGARVTREWLAGLLWGAHAEERARASLRQALSTLRRDLDPHAAAIEVDGEELRLVPERVEVDLAALRERLDRANPDDLEVAARLVRGPFLDGLEPDEPAFLEWREHERQRAHAAALTALRQCAFERVADDPDTAIDHLQRCLELEPHHEAVHRELMRAYDAAGRTAEALRHYDELCRRLATDLSAHPASETETLAETLRAPRASAPTTGATPDAAGPEDSTVTAPAPADERSATRHAVILAGRLDLPTNGMSAEHLEDVHATASERLAETEAIVESHDGRFLRRGGTRFLAVFGLEHARGSEAERAIRTATDLRDWQADHQGAPHTVEGLRCVITCGRVTVDSAGDALRITGDPVERAERIGSTCPAGEVVLDEGVRRLVQDHARLTLRPADSPDDEPVWRLQSMRAGGTSAGTTPLVGRTDELAEIDRALEGTLRERCAHLVLVRGEAGIGKTRLVQEVGARAAERGFDRHAATVLDFGVAEGEDAVSTLLRSLLGRESLQRKDDIDTLIAEGVLEPGQEPFLLDLLDIPQPPAMRALYAAMDNDTRRRGQLDVLVHLVARRSRDNPVLLSLEDIHWADERTLRMLAELVRNIVDRPVVLIMTSRIEGDPISRPWLAARRAVPMLTLDLAPLREAEARELAGHLGAAAGARVERCLARAEGNPLFLVQLLQAADAPAGEPIPPSIQSLVQIRLDALEPDARRALQAAAIIGPRFSLDALEALLGVRPDVESLLDSCLVESRAEGNVFSHALLRDAIRASLPADRRRELHTMAAEWFRERDSILHARHLDSADDERAPLAYLEAARRQADDFHYEHAAELIERGLVLARDRGERSRLLMCKGEVLTDSGRLHEAITVLREAGDNAPDPMTRCRVLVDIAAAMRVTDQIDEAFAYLDEAEPLARQADQRDELARLCHLRGSLHFPRGHLRECMQWQQWACRYAGEADSPALEAMALGGLADAYYAQGCFLQARDTYGRCVRLAEENGLGRTAVANRIQIGSLKKYTLEVAHGIAHARHSIELARTVGHQRAELLAHHSMAFLLMETGAADEMLQHVECADTLIERLQSKRFMPRSLYYRAKAHMLMGERQRARDLLMRACHACRESDAAFVGPSIFAALALATTDERERRQLLEEARQVLDRGALVHNRVEYHRDCIEVAIEETDPDALQVHADALASAMAHEPTPYTDCLVERARLLARWYRDAHDTCVSDSLRRLSDRLFGASCTVLATRITDALDLDRANTEPARD